MLLPRHGITSNVDDGRGDKQRELPTSMLLEQSEALKLIDVSIHLWCGTALGDLGPHLSRQQQLRLRDLGLHTVAAAVGGRSPG
jgi:hypothetical protein